MLKMWKLTPSVLSSHTMIYPIQKSSSFDFIKEARKQAKNRMRKANEPKNLKKSKDTQMMFKVYKLEIALDLVSKSTMK